MLLNVKFHAIYLTKRCAHRQWKVKVTRSVCWLLLCQKNQIYPKCCLQVKQLQYASVCSLQEITVTTFKVRPCTEGNKGFFHCPLDFYLSFSLLPASITFRSLFVFSLLEIYQVSFSCEKVFRRHWGTQNYFEGKTRWWWPVGQS